MRKPVIALALVVSLVLAGCGSKNASAPSTTTTSEPAPPASTTIGTPSTVPADIPNISVPAKKSGTAHLTDVRVAHQPAGDRITFEFAGDSPGYDIGYATMPPRESGSGKEVPVAGSAGIAVRFEGASAVNLTGGYKKTYKGPSRLTAPDTTAVTEVVSVSDSDGSLLWAVGVKEKRPFGVEVLTSPARVVIDLR